MPYFDVTPDHKYFKEIQRIGATGLLRGTGINYKWANQTWFYPEREINEWELIEGFKSFYLQLEDLSPSGKLVDIEFCAKLFAAVAKKKITAADLSLYLKIKDPTYRADKQEALPRKTVAVLIDHFLNPFAQQLDFNGNHAAVQMQKKN
jgi:hypothetical protein